VRATGLGDLLDRFQELQLERIAVDTLHEMAGGNGIYTKYPLERLMRDAHSATAHIGFNWDAGMSTWGLVALGGEVVNPTM